MQPSDNVLSGVRVVELATVVFVPSTGTVMSDFGAEVIKIEPPGGGDIYRRFHELPAMPDCEIDYCWQLDGRNKKSVVLDLKTEEGREAAYRVIETADVFTTNCHPSVLEKLGMTWELLRSRNRRLVFAHGTGFGTDGREVEKPGYDMVCYWSRSGLEGTMFPLEGELGPITCGSGDHPTGMTLFGAIMLALYRREKTGEGSYVSTSLLANGAWSNSCTIEAQLCGATFHPRRPRAEAINFTNLYYRPRDGRIFKLCIVDIAKDWAPFCHAIGRPEIATDPRFALLADRLRNMRELIVLIDAAFAEHDLAYWRETLERAEIPHSVLPTYQEIAEDGQMWANGVFAEMNHPVHGAITVVSSPISVGGQPKVTPRPAPGYGEHTRQVLASAGYDEAEIERLLAAGRALAPVAP
jgi:formyl-CoA transferase